MRTPTPWKIFHIGHTIEIQKDDGKNPIVAWAGFDNCDRQVVEHLANAKYIVLAVNEREKLLKSHDVLITAAKSAIGQLGNLSERVQRDPSDQEKILVIANLAAKLLQEAISLAQEGK